jgi:nucleoside-diphosphate-sugar epimerase
MQRKETPGFCTLVAVTAATRVLVTGSSGHLGEALVRVLRDGGYEVTGIDVLPSP